MTKPDDGLAAIKQIQVDFAEFLATFQHASEADTRAQIIDRMLHEVLCWPLNNTKREEPTVSGYIDYSLSCFGRKYVVLEAKRESAGFVLPLSTSQTQKRFSLSGSLVTNDAIKGAIEQVHTYCSDSGIRYAVATNGVTWIIFRALREDMPWRKGSARVFPSLKDIEQHFTDFWNLLSYESVTNGSMEEEFGSSLRTSRALHRVSSNLLDRDTPLQRNRLHAQLDPVIVKFFDDIAGQKELEILKKCYVHTGSLRVVAKDLGLVIEDTIPHFLKIAGTHEIEQGPSNTGKFGDSIASEIPTTTETNEDTRRLLARGRLFLLLGGIGAGKTTFLRRYQRDVAKELLDKFTAWFHITFIAPPTQKEDIEGYIWSMLMDTIRNDYGALKLEWRPNVKRAFADKLKALRQSILRGLHPDSDEYEERLSPVIKEWQANLPDYISRILRRYSAETGRRIVVFIDNVDQMPADYQSTIFLAAQRITDMLNSVTVVALREESYYSAAVQKVFNAYTNQKFHIASPLFRKVIGSRISFALKDLEKNAGERIVQTAEPLDTKAISELLKIVQYSVFERNRNIAHFIDAINFGNMRNALQMFAMFLTSGATDVDKMLRIYDREGAYYVAFHEFVKSVMLGERRYYRETESPLTLMNVFDVGAHKNSSHFTTLRICGC